MNTNNDLLEHAVRVFPAPEGTFDELSRRRGRKRRNQRVAAGAMGVILSAGLLVAIVSVVRSQPGLEPGASSEQTKTATVNGITITYPESWFALDPREAGIETPDSPSAPPSLVLVLTPQDPITTGVLGCPGLADAPPGQLLMTIQEEPLALTGDGAAPWPAPLTPMELPGDSGDSACYASWTFMRSSWTTEGRSFEARVGFAPDVTEADSDAVRDAYASMSFSPPAGAPFDGYTIVGTGTAQGGVTWTMSVGAAGEYCLRLDAEDSHSSETCSSTAPPTGTPEVGILSLGAHASAYAVGEVPEDVFAVVLETGDGTIGDIGLFDGPKGSANVRYFVVPLPGSNSGTLRFQNRQGNDIYPSQHIEWTDEGAGMAEGSSSASGSSSAAPSP
jgi:hypothetical protein